MAISQIFKTLTFGGVNSGDYGIYITGEAVYNAPERNVEIISVPGRNGDIVIDKGNFKNVEVTYHAGTYGSDQMDFRTRIGSFRNALKAQSGYQRLTDTYHPDQYRMAVFVDAFEVEAEPVVAGEFDLIFNAKPQRWLTAGETPVVVADGETLNNPTLFDAEPLLAIKGSGTVGFNGYEINIINPYRGDVMLIEPNIYTPDNVDDPWISKDLTYNNVGGVANTGDTITIKPITVSYNVSIWQRYYGDEVLKACSVTDEDSTLGGTSRVLSVGAETVRLTTTLDQLQFALGNISTYQVFTHTTTVKVGLISNGSLITRNYTATFDIRYKISNGNLTVKIDFSTDNDEINQLWMNSASSKGVSVYSTVSILGDPTYLDCELGEAYMIEDGEIVSLNQHIDMGSRLPRLASGNNEFEITGNITELKVTSRWWEL